MATDIEDHNRNAQIEDPTPTTTNSTFGLLPWIKQHAKVTIYLTDKNE